MVFIVKKSPLTFIKGSQSDIHIRATETDVRETLGFFAECAQTIKEIACGAVGIELEATLKSYGTFALFPPVFHRTRCSLC
jgi:hypothetical protein